MCGRFVLSATPEIVQQEFHLKEAPTLQPRYNITPSQPVAVVTNDSPDTLTIVQWGLVPSWSKDPKVGSKMTNARAETVAEKPSFRTAYKYRRCIIPASGFYEWTTTDNSKQPYYIFPTDTPFFAFAGLWEVWRDGGGGELWTCSILTTAANEHIGKLHHRMPVILDRKDYGVWLDKQAPQPVLDQLLQSYDSDRIQYYPVSKAVNSPANDSAALIRQDEPPQQQSMF